MKLIQTFTALAALTLAACASNETAQAPAEKPKMAEAELTTITATVEAVDVANRMVTLRGPRGNVVTIDVSENVRNLPQVQVGDQVMAQYYESVAVQVLSPDDPQEGVQAEEVLARAEPGAKPAGGAVERITVTTTLEAIDKQAQTVTLKGPRGAMRTVKVRDPRKLDQVAVGDKVVISYTQALAISVEALQ